MKKLLFIFLMFSAVLAFSQEKAPTDKELEEQMDRLRYELEKSKEEFDDLKEEVTINYNVRRK